MENVLFGIIVWSIIGSALYGPAVTLRFDKNDVLRSIPYGIFTVCIVCYFTIKYKYLDDCYYGLIYTPTGEIVRYNNSNGYFELTLDKTDTHWLIPVQSIVEDIKMNPCDHVNNSSWIHPIHTFYQPEHLKVVCIRMVKFNL